MQKNETPFNQLLWDLSKTDWKHLEKLGLINPCNNHGNGFSNTTTKVDDNISIGSQKYTIIKTPMSNVYFCVIYMSGCFYPIWQLIRSFEDVKPHYEVDKKGQIKRL